MRAKTLRKILFPTDFSRCANQALAHALYWARRYHAELHMLHVTLLHEDDPYNRTKAAFKQLKKMAAQTRADIKARRADELKIKQVQRRGVSTAPVILDYAGANDIDLIVMGTHGRRGLGHLFLGSVAEEVVRLARCSVFTIRECKAPRPGATMKRILVPLDFSDYSEKALAYAKEFAAVYGARLQLLHVIEDAKYPAFYVPARISYFDRVPDLATKAKQALKKTLQETAGPEVAADLYVITGRAAIDIVKFAKSHAVDLIVIATFGLTGIRHLLLGSVTENVVRRAPCPVLIVKRFGKSPI